MTVKKLEAVRVVKSLVVNGLRYRARRLLRAPMRPWYLELAVTNRCNSRCAMCGIWKLQRHVVDPRDLEPSREELTRLLSSPLFFDLVELVLTGGEPFLRLDLVELVGEIVSLTRHRLTSLRTIVLVTNGFLTRKVISLTEDLMLVLEQAGIELVVVCSLDGIGQVHDAIRGRPGAFRRAVETVQALTEQRQGQPGLQVGIKTTILPQNLGELDRILEFVETNDLFLFISPAMFTPARFRNVDQEKELGVGSEYTERVKQFYASEKLGTDYGHKRLHDSLVAGSRTPPCTAGWNFLFVDADSSVYPCAVLPQPMGSYREHDVLDIWHSDQARRLRGGVGDFETCQRCTELGAIRASGLLEGFDYLGFLFGQGLWGAIEEAYWEKGLSKYVGGSAHP